jgi:hypothetical protein
MKKQQRFALFGFFAVLIAGLALVNWLREKPAPIRIDFVEFRRTPAGMVSVFRAVNRSAEQFSYRGTSASRPGINYLVPEGSSWTISTGPQAAFSGSFVLPPNGTAEFFVMPPPPRIMHFDERSPDGLAWHFVGDRGPRGTKSSGVPNSYAIAISFHREQKATRLSKALTTATDGIRDGFAAPVHWAFKKNLISWDSSNEILEVIYRNKKWGVIRVDCDPISPP